MKLAVLVALAGLLVSATAAAAGAKPAPSYWDGQCEFNVDSPSLVESYGDGPGFSHTLMTRCRDSEGQLLWSTLHLEHCIGWDHDLGLFYKPEGYYIENCPACNVSQDDPLTMVCTCMDPDYKGFKISFDSKANPNEDPDAVKLVEGVLQCSGYIGSRSVEKPSLPVP